MADISFSNLTLTLHIERAKAELYMQLYPYAAEDFQSIPDALTFADEVIAWAEELEAQAVAQGEALAEHTHEITPHTHSIPYHTHTVMPHTHITTSPGSPTTTETPMPGAGILSTITSSLIETLPDLPMTNQTLVADNFTDLFWEMDVIPSLPVNTTLAFSNTLENKIIPKSIVTVGDIEIPVSRRKKIIEVLLVPDVPPLLVEAAAEGLA